MKPPSRMGGGSVDWGRMVGLLGSVGLLEVLDYKLKVR